MDIAEKPQETANRIRFIHKMPENYPLHYANGVFGAVTPRGDFEMNFFFEHRDVPEGEVLNYEEGKYKPEEQNLTEATITRDFKVGIIMSPEQTEALGNWLINIIKEYREKQANK